MRVIETEGSVPIKAWVDGVLLEASAEQQLRNVASLRGVVGPHVAVMPDVHGGIGGTVGSVIPTEKAIIPACVGVDIGCGMMAVRLDLTASELPDHLGLARSAIEGAVPHGRTDGGGRGDKGAWQRLPKAVEEAWAEMAPKHAEITSRYGRVDHDRKVYQLGTLGSGNHFIEVCLDEAEDVWIMLHSGSRGAGNRVGTHFISLARKEMERWCIHLPDKDLAYLPQGSEHFSAYIEAVRWAQDYARRNRQLMMDASIGALSAALGRPLERTEEAVNCHHNYVSRERHLGVDLWITRKGAVSAREGEMGIIPGSMGARSFIVRGKGDVQSFHSCSHGAGRAMSRTEARKRFTTADHVLATKGVECRKDEGVIDETPAAYKDIDQVMAAQSDLVEVVHTLKQVLCVKG